MAEIRYTPLAERDLIQMWQYIAVDLASPLAADSVLGKVTAAVRALGRQPMMGESVEARSGRKTDLRYAVGGKRVILYRYEKDCDMVSVIRIFSIGANWTETLFGSHSQD